jgi:hypothetical protein
MSPAAWSVCSTFARAGVIGVLITFVVYHEYLLVFWQTEKWLISAKSFWLGLAVFWQTKQAFSGRLFANIQ